MYDMKKENEMFNQLNLDIMMDRAQMDLFLSSLDNPDYCAFAEDREYPIHSVDELPIRWVGRKNGQGFIGDSQPGEFYAFQIGIYAAAVELKNIQVSCSDLVSDRNVISSAELCCFNLGGIDCWGKKMVKTIDVDMGRVQPLWFGVAIPRHADGNTYYGSVAITADDVDTITVGFQINVSGEALEDCGDSEPWRHSRLRWLDSTIAVDDELTAPFTPLTVKDTTVEFLGRKVVLAQSGLPKEIHSMFSPTVETIDLKGKHILAAPMNFVVDSEFGKIGLQDSLHFKIQKPGLVSWEAQTTDGNITLTCYADMEFDGYIEYRVVVEAKKTTKVNDISLNIPYSKQAAVYKMGMGEKGSYRKEDLNWKWDSSLNQDTLWMGDVNAGLMVRLKGTNYEKPYMLVYYHYKPLNIPECWDNNGKGGCTVKESVDSIDLRAYSGERVINPGEKLEFIFDLSITPVKPINKQEHWNDHYFHDVPSSLKEVSKAGANIVNLHHANELNPFINYPFFETELLANFVKKCHDNSIRAKIYYTIKEITVRMTEIWALRSLGDEVIPYTYEIGSSFQGSVPYADEWLSKYFKDRYITAWRQKVTHGKYNDEMEASVVVSPMSRFNNYFLEGLKWILDNTNMDGLYFDDVAFDRTIMKRLRKIMDRHHTGCTVDLHSWNYFKNNNVDDSRLAGWGNSMNLYIDNFAFIDRLWFGEGFDYNESPDFWLIEMSGIPFGMMGEMLQNGGNVWRGMVYGMTCRLPNENDPSGVWKLWNEFGMVNATMLGYWNPDCPVKTGNDKVLATVYKKPDKVLIAIASWDEDSADITLDIDFDTLEIDPATAKLTVPYVPYFQESQDVCINKSFTVKPGEGLMLILE